MTTERDPFHKHVEFLENRKWRCNFCGKVFSGSKPRIRPHLAGISGCGIKACQGVDGKVREEFLKAFNGKSTGGTSGTGTEGTVSGTSQSVAPSEGASNPNDVQNSNRPGCVPQQPSFYPPTGAGTAPAGPQDRGSLPPGNMPVDNLDNTQQSDPSNRRLESAHGTENASSRQQLLMGSLPSPSLGCSELPMLLRDEFLPDAPVYSPESIRHDFLPENLCESFAKVFEEIEAGELHNPEEVDGANPWQDCGQPRGVEEVPVPSPTNIFQQSGQLPPRCDEEDGNDIRWFPSQTPMDIDPSTALQHPSDSHIFEATTVDSLVPEASTNPIGPSLSHDSVPPQRQIVPHRSINLETVHQNPTVPSSSWENHLVTGHPQVLMDMDPCMPSSSQAPSNAPPPPQILPCGTGLIGRSSLPELDMNVNSLVRAEASNNALPSPQHLPCGTGLTGPSSLPEIDMNVNSLVRAEASQKNIGEVSGLDKSTGGTSGTGTEGTVSGTSQSVAPSEGASNPNDVQNSNQLGCVLQQQPFHMLTATGIAQACLEDQGSLPPGNIFLDILDNTRQSDPSNRRLDAAHGNESASSLQQLQTGLQALSFQMDLPLEQREQNSSERLGLIIGEMIRELRSTENPHCSLPENPLESRDVIVNTSKEIQTNEPRYPTVGSSLQNDSSLDVDSANCSQDCGQLCVVEGVPVRSNTSPTDTVQHPGQLPPTCDKEDGNDIHRFPSPTPMDIPITASQELEASTNTLGPLLAHPSAPPQRQIVPHGSINLTTVHQNPTLPSSLSKNNLVTCHPQALMDKDSCMPSASQAPNNAPPPPPPQILPCGTGLLGPSSIPEIDMNEDAPMTSHPNTRNNFEENRASKRKLELLYSKGAIKVNKLLEYEMVGEAFQMNTTKILEYLVGNQISRLGIYGMGGVGKTTIIKHIHNRLLEEANYGNVLWISASQNFNAKKLQDAIWNELGLGKLQANGAEKRAATLCNCLMERGKSTIILDDVWECFDLQEVGIPADGIKLVLTTRFFKVCCQMQCQQMIKIEPLSNIEAEHLFLKELQVDLNLEIKAIVMSIIKEFAGLPLAIITTARSMRGANDVFEWKDCLEKLRESDLGQMKKVLKKLKFSYDRLRNHENQQCFLSCALYPDDELIDKFELIEFFIDQGLIGPSNMREKQYNRGLTILKELVNACLLEDHEEEIKMHDLIRDMALDIMRLTSIVQAGKGLTRIPYEENWTDGLEKVSLMKNAIGEFPSNMSPNCPKLSIFLMNENFCYNVVIPYSFFEQLRGLKVLNLSRCRVRELPDSISDLVNLRALLLRYCEKLRRIPYLGKLRSLRKLDILYCKKVKALKGLKKLVDLRYLDISGTRIKQLPKETLGALLNLQYLNAKAINVGGIAKLRALETLTCFLEDVDDFNEFARMASKEGKHCYNYISVDQGRPIAGVEVAGVEVTGDAQFGHCRRTISIESCGHANVRTISIRSWSHAIGSAGRESSGSGICILIPQDVKRLTMFDCGSAKNLSDMSPLEDLEELTIGGCKNLRNEEVIDIHNSPAPLLFPRLRYLFIYRCSKLKYLFGHGLIFSLEHLKCITIEECDEMVGITVAVRSPPPHLSRAFPDLEDIDVSKCNKMKRVVESEWLPDFLNLKTIQVLFCDNVEEIIGGPPPYMPVEEISLEELRVLDCDNLRKLFPHELLSHLRNLQSIQVGGCKGMVEMISGAGQGQEGGIMTFVNNMPSSFQSSISLPKLNTLWLTSLPQLKSVCEDSITCYSMETLLVWRCPELNRIPLRLKLHDIKDLPFIQVEGEETWNMLIWDDPNTQTILQPHLRVWGTRYTLGRRRNNRPNHPTK